MIDDKAEIAQAITDLRAARELIAVKFGQGEFAKKDDPALGPCSVRCSVDDPDASCFCSIGALEKVSNNPNVPYNRAGFALGEAAARLLAERNITEALLHSDQVVYVNDQLGREATIEMFNNAIANLERQLSKEGGA